MSNTVTRYVVTHIGRDGLRTLACAAQGRCTFSTPEAAQKWLDAVLAENGDRLSSFYGLPLEVRACECWAGHFDPVGIYFDDSFKCPLCGQVITDGKPCGCGART